MAYIDRQSGTSRATSLATVAVIHAGLGAVLLYGLATDYVLAPPDKRLEGGQIPLPDLPPPPPEKTAQDEPVIDSTITTPPTRNDLSDSSWTVDKTPAETPTEIAIFVSPPNPPTELPPARPIFPIKSPRPANDQSRWVTTADYPASSIRRGEEGTTRFSVSVSSTGKVQGCEITGSSGFEALDAAVCRNVLRRAKFDPGSNAQGEQAAGSYSSKVVWRIPKD